MSTLLCSAAGAALVVTSKSELLFTHNLFLSLRLSPALNFPAFPPWPSLTFSRKPQKTSYWTLDGVPGKVFSAGH